MKPVEMRELFAFNAWANRKIIGAAEALTTEQFTKSMGSSFDSVRDTLVHIWAVEWVWLERLQRPFTEFVSGCEGICRLG